MMADKTQKEQQTIVINDVEYKPEDLNEEQVMLVNHVADLDRKIQSSMFNLDQLQGGREFFMKKLEEALENQDDETEAEVV
tara:strand:- start:718 stop:960 length:243 start_codon:yes stop_codon:yes gene_type:complete